MTVTIEEIPGSRQLSMAPPRMVTKWVCEGEDDATTVANLAMQATPPIVTHPAGILHRQDIDVQEAGYLLYDITVPYAAINIVGVSGGVTGPLGSWRISGSSTGGTIRVRGGTHVAVYPPGGKTFDGLIGVKGDDCEGTDIVVPAQKISVHFQHPAGVMTPNRFRACSRLVGAVDTGGFLGWDPYETLFLGVEAQDGSDVAGEATYDFAMSENLVNATIGGITGIAKKGWDVAWIKYVDAVEGSGPSKEVECVNVVRVYKERDLASILGFGR